MASGETLKVILNGLRIVVIDVSLPQAHSSLPPNMKQAHFYDLPQSHTL